jgi:hypothetical protein
MPLLVVLGKAIVLFKIHPGKGVSDIRESKEAEVYVGLVTRFFWLFRRARPDSHIQRTRPFGTAERPAQEKYNNVSND